MAFQMDVLYVLSETGLNGNEQVHNFRAPQFLSRAPASLVVLTLLVLLTVCSVPASLQLSAFLEKEQTKMFCVCQNSTLDHVSVCTPGRLNNMAPWLVLPHAPRAPQLHGPTAHRPTSPSLAPLSHPPLILIQPGMPFALYGLLA